eukprot:4914439-Prymnesium_polylepis.1
MKSTSLSEEPPPSTWPTVPHTPSSMRKVWAALVLSTAGQPVRFSVSGIARSLLPRSITATCKPLSARAAAAAQPLAPPPTTITSNDESSATAARMVSSRRTGSESRIVAGDASPEGDGGADDARATRNRLTPVRLQR